MIVHHFISLESEIKSTLFYIHDMIFSDFLKFGSAFNEGEFRLLKNISVIIAEPQAESYHLLKKYK